MNVAAISNIATAISQATGEPFQPSEHSPVHGGDINTAFRLSDSHRTFFVKTNLVARQGMFEAEAAGLAEILSTQTLRSPRPICSGSTGKYAFLVLEYLELHGRRNDAEMGRQLANMHRCKHASQAARFGWQRDNTIGSTPQINTWSNDWLTFYGEQRLGYQLRLAQENGYGKTLTEPGEKLIASLPAFFSGYAPAPSLLHGDLWGGNAGFTLSGEPVTFDPAVYYGDRETDLAMTELFGGFGPDFYAAYLESWPLDPGYAKRKKLYQLYHILNHLNLFGGGYLSQAQSMIRQLLAECV